MAMNSFRLLGAGIYATFLSLANAVLSPTLLMSSLIPGFSIPMVVQSMGSVGSPFVSEMATDFFSALTVGGFGTSGSGFTSETGFGSRAFVKRDSSLSNLPANPLTSTFSASTSALTGSGVATGASVFFSSVMVVSVFFRS